jgi:hypothetical protein
MTIALALSTSAWAQRHSEGVEPRASGYGLEATRQMAERSRQMIEGARLRQQRAEWERLQGSMAADEAHKIGLARAWERELRARRFDVEVRARRAATQRRSEMSALSRQRTWPGQKRSIVLRPTQRTPQLVPNMRYRQRPTRSTPRLTPRAMGRLAPTTAADGPIYFGTVNEKRFIFRPPR